MSNKILVCSPHQSSFTKPVLNALISLGYQVRTFDYQKGNGISRSLGLLSNTLPPSLRLPFRAKIHQHIQNQLIQLVTQWKPKLVFVIKGENLSVDTLGKIHALGSKTLNWYPDWLIAWKQVKKIAPHYDYFFSMCDDLAIKTKSINKTSRFVLPATEPDKLILSTRQLPISFVGQQTTRREFFFREIADLGLHIWGYDRWERSQLRAMYHGQVSSRQCLDILRNSCISVNVLTGNTKFQPKAINVRTFETLGTGTFLLVQDHPLLYKYFKPGKDFVTFKTPQELRKKAQYYLKHENERQKIAEHGWNTIKLKHTYKIRLEEMFKYINF